MLPPVSCVNRCVLDWISAVDHHIVAHIDRDMACAGCVVRTLEENDISGFRLACRYDGKLLPQSLRRRSAIVPSVAAVVDYPADKAGTVKAR